jgi:hypothetical protein
VRPDSPKEEVPIARGFTDDGERVLLQAGRSPARGC